MGTLFIAAVVFWFTGMTGIVCGVLSCRPRLTMACLITACTSSATLVFLFLLILISEASL